MNKYFIRLIDQGQDMAWSVCVGFRRLLDLPVDYCFPSLKYASSKLIIEINNIPEYDHLNGIYLEKGLPKCVIEWIRQSKKKSNTNDGSNAFITVNVHSLPVSFDVKPKVYEKLIRDDDNIWNELNKVSLILINQGLLYKNHHWYINHVTITYNLIFHIQDTRFDPSANDLINVVSKENIDSLTINIKYLHVRFTLIDEYSEFHVYTTQTPSNNNKITFSLDENENKHMTVYQRRYARKRAIIFDQINNTWCVHIENNSQGVYCADNDKRLELKSSWKLCAGAKPSGHEAPPMILLSMCLI